MVPETKIDETFPKSQFFFDRYRSHLRNSSFSMTYFSLKSGYSNNDIPSRHTTLFQRL